MQKEEISEYNIYRFKNIKKGNKRMLAIIAYKENSTGNPKYLMKNISKKRNTLLEALINFTLPEINLITN